MSQISQDNHLLFSSNYLSTNDVLLKPTCGTVKSRKDINISETFIYSSPMDTVASQELINEMEAANQASLSCRFKSMTARIAELNLNYENENYWFSVGTSFDDFQALATWASSRPKAKINIAVDVAHGDTIHLHALYKRYSSCNWCRHLMCGTIATGSSAARVYDSGCTHIRVGIGPGSACTTRIVTGCGVPNLTAIYDTWLTFQDPVFETQPVIIADGGIKTSGDIAKYLSAGADAVMIGSLLSKCEESAGWKIDRFKKFINRISFNTFYKGLYVYKNYRGQASEVFQIENKGYVSGTAEGVEGPRQYPAYTFSTFFYQVSSALRSTISYLGQKELSTLNPKTVAFIKITENGLRESKPHILG